MELARFAGLDVHKRATSVAIAGSGRGGEVGFLGEIARSPEALGRLVERLKAATRSSASATRLGRAATACIGCSTGSARTAAWSRRR
jgi:hypothetical protein